VIQCLTATGTGGTSPLEGGPALLACCEELDSSARMCLLLRASNEVAAGTDRPSDVDQALMAALGPLTQGITAMCDAAMPFFLSSFFLSLLSSILVSCNGLS
jgi:hypothetical protein